MRPCTCENHRPGPYTIDQCRLCWLYHNDERYRKLFDRKPGELPSAVKDSQLPKEKPIFDWPCVHRGEKTGETLDCRCVTPEPVYFCNSPNSEIRECVIRKTKAGRILPNVCSKCPVREEPS